MAYSMGQYHSKASGSGTESMVLWGSGLWLIYECRVDNLICHVVLSECIGQTCASSVHHSHSISSLRTIPSDHMCRLYQKNSACLLLYCTLLHREPSALLKGVQCSIYVACTFLSLFSFIGSEQCVVAMKQTFQWINWQWCLRIRVGYNVSIDSFWYEGSVLADLDVAIESYHRRLYSLDASFTIVTVTVTQDVPT